jgi:cytoskeleton protein RodZ
MARPRVSLGLEASRTSLNREVCAEIGRQLQAARMAKGTSIADAAKALMLSPAQIGALETVQPEAFYGADFYTNALKKYLIYLNLSPAESERALLRPAEPEKKPTPFRRKQTAEAQAPQAPPKAARGAAFTPTLVAAAVAASAMAGWWILAPKRQAPTATSSTGRPGDGSPAAEQATAPPPPAPALDKPAEAETIELDAANAAASAVSAVSATLAPVMQASELPEVANVTDASGRYGAITVATSTWIFVRYADNTTDERRIAPGDTFAFRSQPVYIAVGAAKGTTIVVGGRTLDAAPFTTNGQIRIGKAFLGTFVALR